MRGATRASREPAHACKKTSGAAHTHGESQTRHCLPPPPSDAQAEERLCQAGTAADEPFRHTHLKAEFVAQLLGQMLEYPAAPPLSAALAYQASEPRLARLLDRQG